MTREFLEGVALMPEEAMQAILDAHQQALDRQEQDFRTQLFASRVDAAIGAAGGRNVRAVAALLDVQALQQAQDPEQALQQALQQVKRENGYLFGPAVPPPYASQTGAPTPDAPGPMTLADALRERYRK